MQRDPNFKKMSELFLRGAALCVTTGLMIGLVACSPAKWHETHNVPKHTGDPIAEQQTARRQIQMPQPGDRGFVSSDRLCGRRVKDRDCSKDDVIIERNDEIKVVTPKVKKEDKLIEVEVVKSKRRDLPPVTVYVPPEYINETPVIPTVEEKAADRFFVVENVATEKLRIYEKCGAMKDPCTHRLVLETDMIVGQDAKGRRSMLGSYTLTKWFKFYEDNQGENPSWYNPKYPQIPGPGADLSSWAAKSLLPSPKASVRGSFGWYTAYLGPNAEEQWTHGTWGWGKDGSRFVEALRQGPADADGKLASHGCSRVENQAIALMRELLVPGTKVIKIYARESYARAENASMKASVGQWPWILTNEGVNADNGPRSGKASVKQRGVSKKQILEWGVYRFKATPTAVSLSEGGDKHRNGNSYGLPTDAFVGAFNVDEGRLTSDYAHPRSAKLKIGGHTDEHLPSVVMNSTHAPTLPPQVTAAPPIVDDSAPAQPRSHSAKPSKPSTPETSTDPIADPMPGDEPAVAEPSAKDGAPMTEILDPSVISEAASLNL